jgi:diacylglycerol kinase (ATP)
MTENKKLGIILNPVAGRGKAIKAEKELVRSLREKNITFQLEHTQRPLHAISLAEQLSKEYKIIVAAGGDGTANEVARGLLGSKVSMAYLPIGSGNDFNKIVCMPADISHALDTILINKLKIIDVGHITIENTSGKTFSSQFINTLGIGIDATIAKESKHIKYIRGLMLYLLATLKALSYYMPIKFFIKIDGKEFVEESFLFCVGNGKFEGGGFNMVPNAIPDDQFFDICLIKKMSIRNALTVIPMVIKGTHGKHNQVVMMQAKVIELTATEPFVVHADGEILEDMALKIRIEIAKKKLSLITA